jgi:hypothetical protein
VFVPIPVSNPAVGSGLQAAVLYLHPLRPRARTIRMARRPCRCDGDGSALAGKAVPYEFSGGVGQVRGEAPLPGTFDLAALGPQVTYDSRDSNQDKLDFFYNHCLPMAARSSSRWGNGSRRGAQKDAVTKICAPE